MTKDGFDCQNEPDVLIVIGCLTEMHLTGTSCDVERKIEGLNERV